MKDYYHDIRMKEVYAKIYTGCYNFCSAEMKYARYIISKNLKELSIPQKEISNFNVLNIGTGRETKVFHELGAKNIYHFDVSNLSVSALKKIRIQDAKFKNIYTRRGDVCEMQDLKIKHGIDLVYLNGVLHHLHAPENFFQKIFKALNPSAKLFFRIYKSGSITFFIVDFIRKFIGYEDKYMFDQIFWKRYPNNQKSRYFYTSAYDNLFVPVLRLYKPEGIDNFFINKGFRVLAKRNFPDYDHNDILDLSGEGVSLFYQKLNLYSKDKTVAFPCHVDQMRDITYKKNYITNTVHLMGKYLKKVKHIEPKNRIAFAIDLYGAVKKYRLLIMNNQKLQKGNRISKLTGKDIHKNIQDILKKAI